MYNQQYVTITHYKEREFFFLNHAIQTTDGFIAKEIEQFHESEEAKFIERIRALQTMYPKHQVISLSLMERQVVKEREEPNKVSALIFKNNYVIQDKLDMGNIPVTLYFSPFSLLYEEYQSKLSEKLTLIIGYFDRKLYIMFATNEKIHESWIIGTRGLSEKQIANRVSKSMKAYYKISYKFAEHVEMLVTDDSPKLLKVLREELSMSIVPTQKTIHFLLHHMGAEQSRFGSSFIKSFLSTSHQVEPQVATPAPSTSSMPVEPSIQAQQGSSLDALASSNNIPFNNSQETLGAKSTEEMFIPTSDDNGTFFKKIKTLFGKDEDANRGASLFSIFLFFSVLASGGYLFVENSSIEKEMRMVKLQSSAQKNNMYLAVASKSIFNAMGKSAELKSASITENKVDLKGLVWGIEPLRNALVGLYKNGDFSIKPLENFMTEFSFKAKV